MPREARRARGLAIGGLLAGLPIVAAQAVDAIGGTPPAAPNPGKALELPTIEVIGTTLLPGLGTPVREVPANIQAYTQEDLARQQRGDLAEYLERNATGVTVNAAQGNPFQPDVGFRGFTASPLLGTPQGLSVFQDGVRVNEAFGDIVNWDLIPQSAIASVELIPGSNPVFGLNTLGGALAIQTKSGSTNPGGALQLSGGSFGRRAFEFEQGGKSGSWDYFLTGNLLRDTGWAEHNPSRLAQFFGKLGYRSGDTDLDLSLTVADNTLQGTQTLPLSFPDIRQAYTYPDRSDNRLGMLSVKGSRFIGDNLLLGGNLYYRDYRNQSVASNVNHDFGEIDPATGLPDPVQASNDRAAIDQAGYGFGLQLTYLGQLAGKKNQLMIGASADLGRARFRQDSQPAQFDAGRGTVPIGAFVPQTDAQTRNRYYGLFVSDQLALAPRWTLTLSGRYNLAEIEVEDRSGSLPALNGEHSFSRFDPALGLNFNPNPGLTLYASYNEGMRAPTPIELSCADPDAPCKLPNNFLSDPALSKVVAKTVEIGARGRHGAAGWSVAVFRTALADDIQFVSSQGAGSNAGYFQNVGDSRRQGLELSGSGKWGGVAVTLRYSYIDATYRSRFLLNSPANTSADAGGAITVLPGNRIPGIPRHNLKLRLDYDLGQRWSVGGSILAASDSIARGDENNRDARGPVPGYAVVDLDTRVRLEPGLELFARIANLFDREYANFGVLGENVFTGPGRGFDGANAVSEPFRGHGAPRALWVGLRYRWR